MGYRDLQKQIVRLKVTTENITGSIITQYMFITFLLDLGIKLLHVCIFNETDYLHSSRFEVLQKACHLQSGTVDIRLIDLDILNINVRRQIDKFHFFDQFTD